MKLLGIFGTSGLAREVNDVALELGYQSVYIARSQADHDGWSFPGDVVLESELDRYPGMQFTIGIGDNKRRQVVAETFGRQLDFVSLIHPAASFGRSQYETVAKSKGVIILAGARFTNNIRIGNFTVVNPNATIAHDVIIDEFVNIAPGANISGNVHISRGCLIGSGAVINQGTNEKKLVIGAETVIGSGAVVTGDCDPNAVYVGVPARRIR
jgi:sugar O-acyltransferase (sialic acid O-acetyltransferase NeuD family)